MTLKMSDFLCLISNKLSKYILGCLLQQKDLQNFVCQSFEFLNCYLTYTLLKKIKILTILFLEKSQSVRCLSAPGKCSTPRLHIFFLLIRILFLETQNIKYSWYFYLKNLHFNDFTIQVYQKYKKVLKTLQKESKELSYNWYVL